MTVGATENITNRSLQIKGKRSVYARTSWTSMCRCDIRSHEWHKQCKQYLCEAPCSHDQTHILPFAWDQKYEAR